eukprot:1161200-Pelagomonas_calceolata.AAC.18
MQQQGQNRIKHAATSVASAHLALLRSLLASPLTQGLSPLFMSPFLIAHHKRSVRPPLTALQAGAL